VAGYHRSGGTHLHGAAMDWFAARGWTDAPPWVLQLADRIQLRCVVSASRWRRLAASRELAHGTSASGETRAHAVAGIRACLFRRRVGAGRAFGRGDGQGADCTEARPAAYYRIGIDDDNHNLSNTEIFARSTICLTVVRVSYVTDGVRGIVVRIGSWLRLGLWLPLGLALMLGATDRHRRRRSGLAIPVSLTSIPPIRVIGHRNDIRNSMTGPADA